MNHKLIVRISVILALLLVGGCRATPTETKPAAALTIQNKGSDTIVNLALAWAERYQESHPEVRLAVTGGGTGTGITALLNGAADIANASRQIKAEELATARANGIEPQEFVIARDAIAIIVHPSNPINQLTIQQISDIYSGKLSNWRELGGEDRPIVRLSRETNSGTHVYFLEEVVRLGEKGNTTLFSTDTLLLPSSEGIGAEVRQNPNAIGYDGLGYVTADMKTLAVGLDPAGPFWMPSVETVNAQEYPISRDLYMYTVQNPPAHVRQYLAWLTEAEAQAIVLELGFVPVMPPAESAP